MTKINSLREAKKYLAIDWGQAPGGAKLFEVTATCKGCSEAKSFHGDPVDALFAFADQHVVCSEIEIKGQTEE